MAKSYPVTQTPGRPQGGYYGNGAQSAPGQSANGNPGTSGTIPRKSVLNYGAGGGVINSMGRSSTPQQELTTGEWDWLGDVLNGIEPMIQQFINDDTIRAAKNSADQTNAANQARYDEILGNIDNFRNTANDRFNVLGQRKKDNIASTLADFDKSFGEVDNLGRESKRRINEAGSQREASDVSSLSRRGLGNTTVVDARKNQTRQNTDKQILDVEERVGGIKAGIHQQRAEVRMRLDQDLDNFILNRTGFQSGLVSDKNKVIASRTDLDSMLEMLPYIMGGQGAGGASGLGSSGSKGTMEQVGNAMGRIVGTYYGGSQGGESGSQTSGSVGKWFDNFF